LLPGPRRCPFGMRDGGYRLSATSAGGGDRLETRWCAQGWTKSPSGLRAWNQSPPNLLRRAAPMTKPLGIPGALLFPGSSETTRNAFLSLLAALSLERSQADSLGWTGPYILATTTRLPPTRERPDFRNLRSSPINPRGLLSLLTGSMRRPGTQPPRAAHPPATLLRRCSQGVAYTTQFRFPSNQAF
jgi:hypothetical protein